MAKSLGWLLILSLAWTASLSAQDGAGERPEVFVPRKPKTKGERDRLKALESYAAGIIHQRNDRLFEALKCFEEAKQLDPKSAAVCRALIPLYFALGRDDDALAACRQALELDPADPETTLLYSRQLRELGKTKEAIVVLTRGANATGARERIDLYIQLQHDLAQACEDAGQLAQALTAYDRVIKELREHRQALVEMNALEPAQISAEIGRTLERLGKACTKAREYDRAVKAFTEAQRLDPENTGRLHFNLAEVALAQNQTDQALSHVQRYLQLQPPGAEAYETLITVLKKQKRDKEILATLEGYATKDRFNIPLQLLVARRLGEEERYGEAERNYLKLAEENPTPEVYQGLFRLFKDQAKGDRILDLFDRTMKAAIGEKDGEGDRSSAVRARVMLGVLKDDADLVKALLPTVERDLTGGRKRHHETYRLLAILMVRTQQLAAAEKLYRECLPHITPDTEAEVYAGLLDTLSEQGKHAEVVQLARQGLQKAQATNLVLFRTKLATALVQLGKAEEAIKEADEAVKLASDTNRLRLQVFRIEMLRRCDRFEQAIEDCVAMLKEHTLPGDIRSIRHVLSGVYISANQQEKGEEQLRLILEVDPSDAGANNDLGYILADRNKDLEEAEKLIRKAIDLDREEKKRAGMKRVEEEGDNAAYLDSLGWVLFRRGKLEEARTWLEKATSLPEGQDPVLYDHLGDVYLRLQQQDKARAAWKKAIELYDSSSRRKKDDRFQEIQTKLQQLAGKTGR